MKKFTISLLSAAVLATGCKTPPATQPTASPSGAAEQSEGVASKGASLYDSIDKQMTAEKSIEPESNGYALLESVLTPEADEKGKAPYQALNKYVEIYSARGPEAASKALESADKDIETFLTINPTLVEVIKRPNFNWPSQWDDPINATLPNFVPLRDAARGLTMVGLNEERKGNNQNAIDLYMESLLLGSKLSGTRQLIGQMVSVAILNYGQEALGDLLTQRPLSAEQYRQVIKQLNDLPIQEGDLLKATDGEYALMIKTLNMLEKGELNNTDLGVLGIGEAMMVKMIIPNERKAYTEIYFAQRPDFENLTVTFDPEQELEKYKTLVLVPIMYPNLTKALNLWRKTLTNISALKVLAALGAYHAEKNAYPDRLDALVPDYLSELPQDYFSKDGEFLYTKTDKSFTLASSSADLEELDIEGDLMHYPRPPHPVATEPTVSDSATPEVEQTDVTE